MSKPPASTPHSDIDGVHRDQQPNVTTAVQSDQDSGDIAQAKRDARARPLGSEQSAKRGAQSDGPSTANSSE